MSLDFLIFRQARPATAAVGFIHADLQTVLKFVDAWKVPQGSLKPTRFRANLVDALTRLSPLSGMKTLYIECRNGWTAVFRAEKEFKEGEIAYPCRNIASDGIKATYLYSDDDPDNQRAKNGAVMFSTYKGHATDFLNYARSVCLIAYEGRWSFEQGGEPQSYERLDLYQAKRARDRFSLEVLIEYLRAAGIDPCDPSFFTKECGFVDYPPTMG